MSNFCYLFIHIGKCNFLRRDFNTKPIFAFSIHFYISRFEDNATRLKMRTTNEENSVQDATTRDEVANVVVALSSMEENKDGETETGNETTTTTKKEDDLIAEEDGGDECERAPNILQQLDEIEAEPRNSDKISCAACACDIGDDCPLCNKEEVVSEEMFVCHAAQYCNTVI